MLSRLLPLLLVSLVTSPLLAQSPPQSPEPEPSMQGLLDRIEQLEKRIAELEDHERKQATTTPPADSSSETGAGSKLVEAGASPAPASHSEHMGTATVEREAQIHYPSLEIRGFGDGPKRLCKRFRSGSIRAALCFATVPESQLFR
jgi:hypothetical protein